MLDNQNEKNENNRSAEECAEVEAVSGLEDTVEAGSEEAPEMTAPQQSRGVRLLSGVFDYVEVLVFSVCIVLVAFCLFGRLCRVSGTSMNQTLQNGEMLFISNLAGEIQQEDIIVFHMTTDQQTYSYLNEPMVKRVIATGGQTVRLDFDNGEIYVDGQLMDDDFVYLDVGYYRNAGVFEGTVPEGYLFVMGDNRNNSIDSRSSVVGFVDERRVLGKVVCRLAPFTRFN